MATSARRRGQRPGVRLQRPVRTARRLGPLCRRPVAPGDDASPRAERSRTAEPAADNDIDQARTRSRVEADRILDHQEATGPDVLRGLPGARPARPAADLQHGRIVLSRCGKTRQRSAQRWQPSPWGPPRNDAEEPALPPAPTRVTDWPRMTSRTWRAERRWMGDRICGLGGAGARLSLLRPPPTCRADVGAIRRYSTHVGTAIERLAQLNGLKRSSAISAVEA